MLGARQGFSLAKSREPGPTARAERLPVVQCRLDLRIPRHGHDAVLLEPQHRASLAQPLVKRIRIGKELRRERIEIQRRAVGFRGVQSRVPLVRATECTGAADRRKINLPDDPHPHRPMLRLDIAGDPWELSLQTLFLRPPAHLESGQTRWWSAARPDDHERDKRA